MGGGPRVENGGGGASSSVAVRATSIPLSCDSDGGTARDDDDGTKAETSGTTSLSTDFDSSSSLLSCSAAGGETVLIADCGLVALLLVLSPSLVSVVD